MPVGGLQRQAEAAQEEALDTRLAEVSRAVVATYKRRCGRGPQRTRSTLANDVLTIVLEDGLTTAEETLLRNGASGQVRSFRRALGEVLTVELCPAIAAILRRRVRSHMSESDPDNRVQVEVFVLEPLASETPRAREELAERAARAHDRSRAVLADHRALRAEQGQTLRELDRRVTRGLDGAGGGSR